MLILSNPLYILDNIYYVRIGIDVQTTDLEKKKEHQDNIANVVYTHLLYGRLQAWHATCIFFNQFEN